MKKGLTSVIEVDAILKAAITPAPVHTVPLEKAAGRILQSPIIADRQLPPYDRVMMDGFAVAWSENYSSETTFAITGRQLAGETPQALPSSPTASAIEIMTGAALPEGTDTIIPYEETDYTKGADSFRLKELEEIESGQCIHRKGSDTLEGATLVEKGSRLGPTQAGVAASCGYELVSVNQLPRIALVGTGDELVPIKTKPAPHQIRRSNATALENALSRAGFPARTTYHLLDDPDAETARLKELIQKHNIVIISGAVSRGTADWIAPALDALGTCLFHGVAQRPGKPMGVWKMANGTIVFGLPGNPVSTLVGLHRHILPYLRRCAGETLITQEVELAEPIEIQSRLTVFFPVRLDAQGRAYPAPTNNSGDFASLVNSDGFVELTDSRNSWTAGEQLPFYPWTK